MFEGIKQMAHDLKAIGEVGMHDALRGLTVDQCSYRAPARKAAWLAGWHKGKQMQQDIADRATVSNEDKQEHRAKLNTLRQLLTQKDG